jgi:hypothetical protein
MTTMQGTHLQPLYWSQSFECLAKLLKPRLECGGKMSILQFSVLGCLIQILDQILYVSAHELGPKNNI